MRMFIAQAKSKANGTNRATDGMDSDSDSEWRCCKQGKPPTTHETEYQRRRRLRFERHCRGGRHAAMTNMASTASQESAPIELVEKVFSACLPLVLSFFEHAEARWYAQVSPCWGKAVARMPFVTLPIGGTEFAMRFLNTSFESGDEPVGVRYKNVPVHFGGQVFYCHLERVEGEYKDRVECTVRFSHAVFFSMLQENHITEPKIVSELVEGSVLKGSDPEVKFSARIAEIDDTHVKASIEMFMQDAENSFMGEETGSGRRRRFRRGARALVKNPKQDALLEHKLHTPIREGVSWADDFLGVTLAEELNQTVDMLRGVIPPDYHPGSEGIVRDIVHPALYPYVHGLSPINDQEMANAFEELTANLSDEEDDEIQDDEEDSDTEFGFEVVKDERSVYIRDDCEHDRWGRPYERSKFQWLPTWFHIDNNLDVKIEGDINGLRPRQRFEPTKVYDTLARVFQLFIPMLEGVINYGRCVRLRKTYDWREEEFPEQERFILRGKSLQVIPKIVDYELQPGQSYEGVWHVEGMSHEHIVATCLYIANRDESIEGGDLLFQRAWTYDEAYDVAEEFSRECCDELTPERFERGLRPLGRVATRCGRGIVFPNSHVHKVTKMFNNSEEEQGTAMRRIIVFFIVDPDTAIISTREVPDQTNVITREQAESLRLELMRERKLHKQDWNVREVNLCEH